MAKSNYPPPSPPRDRPAGMYSRAPDNRVLNHLTSGAKLQHPLSKATERHLARPTHAEREGKK